MVGALSLALMLLAQDTPSDVLARAEAAHGQGRFDTCRDLLLPMLAETGMKARERTRATALVASSDAELGDAVLARKVAGTLPYDALADVENDPSLSPKLRVLLHDMREEPRQDFARAASVALGAPDPWPMRAAVVAGAGVIVAAAGVGLLVDADHRQTTVVETSTTVSQVTTGISNVNAERTAADAMVAGGAVAVAGSLILYLVTRRPEQILVVPSRGGAAASLVIRF